MVDACAYRSRKFSDEPQNRKISDVLPSVIFTRRWLLEAVLPLASAGQRLVVAKRWSLWNVTDELKASPGVIFDPVPENNNITGSAKECLMEWLSDNGHGIWNP